MRTRLVALAAAVGAAAWHYREVARVGAAGGAGSGILFLTAPLAFACATAATYAWFRES
jgi:hypothetical protein